MNFENLRNEEVQETLSENVRKALSKISPSDMLNYFEERFIGQRKTLKKIVCIFFEYLNAVASGKPFKAPCWILTAPSGGGKTEIYRILRDFFKDNGINILVMQEDLSLFSDTGYKGRNIDDIGEFIVKYSDNSDGTAICFLDEADKKCIPSICNGTDYNKALQSNLLTLVEGKVDTYKKDRDKRLLIDTGKTMFVFMGAFQDIRNKRQNKDKKVNHIGFNVDTYVAEAEQEKLFEDITINDIIKYGMLEELAGRMQQVINLPSLSKDNMRKLIREKVKIASGEMNLNILIKDSAVEEFLEISYTNLGVRVIINKINELVNSAISEVYFDRGFSKDDICVTIESVDRAIAAYEIGDFSIDF